MLTKLTPAISALEALVARDDLSLISKQLVTAADACGATALARAPPSSERVCCGRGGVGRGFEASDVDKPQWPHVCLLGLR